MQVDLRGLTLPLGDADAARAQIAAELFPALLALGRLPPAAPAPPLPEGGTTTPPSSSSSPPPGAPEPSGEPGKNSISGSSSSSSSSSGAVWAVEKIAAVSGGITNALWKVSCVAVPARSGREGDSSGGKNYKNAGEKLRLLVRVFGSGSENLVDRAREQKSLQLLFLQRLGPKVYGTFENGYAYEFFDGTPLEPHDLCRGTYLKGIADVLARLHRLGMDGVDERKVVLPPAAAAAAAAAAAGGSECAGGEDGSVLLSEDLVLERPAVPSFVTTIRDWLSQVPKSYGDAVKDAVLAQLDVEKLAREFESLQETLRALESPTVLAHNDLLGPNIIAVGERGAEAGRDETRPFDAGPVKFIDFEYCSHNPRGFDLGNHWCEFAGFELDYDDLPDVEMRRMYARSYLEALAELELAAGGRVANPAAEARATVTDDEVARLVVEGTQFMLAAHFYWATWGLVQAAVSSIDFDYMDYSRQRFGFYFQVRDEYLAFGAAQALATEAGSQ